MAQNWWEAAPVVQPGGMAPRGFVYTPPPDPTKQASEQRAANADARAAETNARASAEWHASHNPDGSPKVQAPSLLGNPNLTGPEYLKSLPQNIRNRVQQLLDGRSLLTAREKGTPLGQQLMDAANQADPSFDENVSHARYVERSQYTGMGKGSQIVQAANRFGRHLGDLYEASRALGGPDLGWAPLSNLATATTNSFRQARVATYNTILPLIQGEVQKLTKNGAATEGEAQHIMASLSPHQPEDVRYSAIKELARLGRAQVEPLHQSWESAWQGSAAPPIPMDVDPVANAIFDAVDSGSEPPKRDKKGEFIVPGVAGDGTPLSGNGGGNGPPTVTPGGGSGPTNGGPQDGQSLTGIDPNKGVLGQTYRNVFDPVTAKGMNALIHRGRPFEEAAAYAQANRYPVPDQKTYAEAVAYAKDHPGYMAAQATRSVPTTIGQRLAASPGAAAAMAFGSASTAGLQDVVGRQLAGPAWDANRAVLGETHQGANLTGNVAGGFAGLLGGNALLSRVAPGVLPAISARLGRAAAPAGDVAYGSVYGANENPNDPVGGAVEGGFAALLGGQVGRSLTRGMANVVAPQAGRYAQAYDLGVLPTVGQRFGRSGILGRGINTAEQALQSVPFLGSLVSRSRQGARDQFQLGAFNDALGDIGHALPDNMAPGTEPHAYTRQAFDNAYDTARSGMQFVPDQPYLADHQAFTGTLNNGVLSAPQAQQVQQVINNAVGSRLPRQGGGLSGDAYKAASKDIGSAVDTWSRNPDTAPMASALRDYQTIFDNAARRNSNSQAVQMLDQADHGYAKFVRIEDAARRVGGDAGTFSPKAFDRSVQNNGGGVRSGNYLRGDALMQDLADAAKGLDDTLPTSGTAERLLTSRAAVGAGGLATGAGPALMAHPYALAPFAAYLPGVDNLVKRAIAPNSTRLSFAPDVAAALDRVGLQINDLAPFVGRAAVPGSLAYYGAGR